MTSKAKSILDLMEEDELPPPADVGMDKGAAAPEEDDEANGDPSKEEIIKQLAVEIADEATAKLADWHNANNPKFADDEESAEFNAAVLAMAAKIMNGEPV